MMETGRKDKIIVEVCCILKVGQCYNLQEFRDAESEEILVVEMELLGCRVVKTREPVDQDTENLNSERAWSIPSVRSGAIRYRDETL